MLPAILILLIILQRSVRLVNTYHLSIIRYHLSSPRLSS